MKALVYRQYGSPGVLQPQDVDKPIPRGHEVLVRVYASSINSWDWDLLTGTPPVYRLLFGIFRPKHAILGFDIAGVVEAIGENVTRFKPGDEVAGDLSGSAMGGFAEYTCAREEDLRFKPKLLSFQEAAAVPQAAVLAYQALTFGKPLKENEKVLINGAGGGVGTFAIQMAKNAGAEVTAVDIAEKADVMLSLGADFVLDCKQTDFTSIGKKYDRIIDVTATRSVWQYSKILNQGGVLGIVGGKVSAILQTAMLGFLFGKKKLGIVVHKANHNLDHILEMVSTGKIKPLIGRCYKLSELSEAFGFYATGNHQGKIVILV